MNPLYGEKVQFTLSPEEKILTRFNAGLGNSVPVNLHPNEACVLAHGGKRIGARAFKNSKWISWVWLISKLQTGLLIKPDQYIFDIHCRSNFNKNTLRLWNNNTKLATNLLRLTLSYQLSYPTSFASNALKWNYSFLRFHKPLKFTKLFQLWPQTRSPALRNVT